MKSKLIFEAWLKRVIKKGILTLGNNRSHFKGFQLNTLDILELLLLSKGLGRNRLKGADYYD